MLVQLSHPITGATAQSTRMSDLDKTQEGTTGSLQFSQVRKCVLCGPKGKPGPKGQKPQGNRFWLRLSNANNERLLLCKVVSPPVTGKHQGQDVLEGLQAQLIDHTMVKSFSP